MSYGSGMKHLLLFFCLALAACATARGLPTCPAVAAPTTEWSKPCRGADEVDSETGAVAEPDPTDLDGGTDQP